MFYVLYSSKWPLFSVMAALHIGGSFSVSFMCWSGSNIPEGVLRAAEHLAVSSCGPIVEVRSCDSALHHSPSWSNSSSKAWRCVGGVSLDHRLCFNGQLSANSTNSVTSKAPKHLFLHPWTKYLLIFSRSDKEPGGWNQNSRSRIHSLFYVVQTNFFLLVLLGPRFLAELQA